MITRHKKAPSIYARRCSIYAIFITRPPPDFLLFVKVKRNLYFSIALMRSDEDPSRFNNSDLIKLLCVVSPPRALIISNRESINFLSFGAHRSKYSSSETRQTRIDSIGSSTMCQKKSRPSPALLRSLITCMTSENSLGSFEAIKLSPTSILLNGNFSLLPCGNGILLFIFMTIATIA